MRGAIGWPEGEREGFIMMAGQDVSTGIIYIFEQAWFWTIDHWLEPDGTIRQREGGGWHMGAVQFIKDWESLYKCASYFFGGQHVDVIRRHTTELYRNQMIPKNIELIEVPYVSEVGDDLIMEKGKTRKFIAGNGTPIHKSVEQWFALKTAGTGDNNAVHALRALLAGFEHQPYVKGND
jgi:hypothetical protein